VKKVTVSFTFYEDGSVDVSGDCDFCEQFPCSHITPEGRIHVPNLKLDIDPTTLLRVAPPTRKSVIKQAPLKEAVEKEREDTP